MDGFAYTSYKHQRDRALLERLSAALLALKLGAQGRLAENGLSNREVAKRRRDLDRFLAALEERVRLLRAEQPAPTVDMGFTGLADRFVRVNEHDVDDRLDELRRIRDELVHGVPLRPHDFRRLDALHALLEEEAAEGVRGLYRL